MKKLENKVAVITGAGSGMGKQIALLFAAEGSNVIATDIDEQRLEELKEEITAVDGEVSILKANMANGDDIDKMIELAVDRYGTLDILVNNAGIMDNFEPAGEVSDALFERVMQINLEGPFRAIRKALQVFLPKEQGVIINIASLGGLHGARAGAAYTMSKHGLIGLTKNTGYMYAQKGIRCNAIAPGAIQTNIGHTIDRSKITDLVRTRVMPGLALNPRQGEPSEVAQAALFLASDQASFINGDVLVVDGGWSSY